VGPGGDGVVPRHQRRAADGGSTQDCFNAVACQNGWSDFAVTVNSEATWSRRFTGHVETGATSAGG
jgi:phospholipase C